LTIMAPLKSDCIKFHPFMHFKKRIKWIPFTIQFIKTASNLFGT
jgi:hypothetical protein